VIRLLVSNYFDIVRSNLADLVPKALMRFLVHHSQRGLQQHLIATLYRCGSPAVVGGGGGGGGGVWVDETKGQIKTVSLPHLVSSCLIAPNHVSFLPSLCCTALL
jgi:hypothetical protein